LLQVGSKLPSRTQTSRLFTPIYVGAGPDTVRTKTNPAPAYFSQQRSSIFPVSFLFFMKNSSAAFLLSFLFAILLSATSFAQGTKAPEDKSKRPSPPASTTAKVGGVTVTINYSRPSVKGRKVFGELEPYGSVWRTGANEATTFEVDKPVTINGQPLAAGKYALFTIPTATDWTIIFNKTADQWGAFKYDDKQDALRVQVTPKKTAKLTEQLLITADKSGKVTIAWENTAADFKVAAAK
jgi:hypothetical protein